MRHFRSMASSVSSRSSIICAHIRNFSLHVPFCGLLRGSCTLQLAWTEEAIAQRLISSFCSPLCHHTGVSGCCWGGLADTLKLWCSLAAGTNAEDHALFPRRFHSTRCLSGLSPGRRVDPITRLFVKSAQVTLGVNAHRGFNEEPWYPLHVCED